MKKETKYNPNDVKLLLKPLGHLQIFYPFVKNSTGLIDRLLKLTFNNFRRFIKPITQLFGFNPENEVIRLKEHLLEVEDGGKLATDVYLPKQIYEKRGKGPTILIRLPYWKDLCCIMGYLFASKGYVTIVQDVRGSAHSIKYGTNSIFSSERMDGLATLRWISNRFWYNKKVGMWGLSYLGLTQLAVSWDNDGLVTCLNPAQCSYTNIFWHPKGLYPIGKSGSIYLLMKMISQYENMPAFSYNKYDKSGHANLLYFDPKTALYNEKMGIRSKNLSYLAEIGKVKYMIKAMSSLYNLKLIMSKQSEDGSFQKLVDRVFYERDMKHDHELAPYAFGFNYKPETPMLMLQSWYDMFVEEFMRDLKLIQQNAPEFVKNNLKLIIGPWAHGNMAKLISLKEDFIFLRKIFPFWWFEHWLKNDSSKELKIPPIQLFVLNKKIWRNFNQWPPKCEELRFYLHSNGKANSRLGDGVLSEKKPLNESPDNYEFDPLNPLVMIGGRNLFLKSGPRNHLRNENRNDILTYTTEKLKEGIEIIGEIKVKFYASSSAKDTDFMVKLLDVSPSGRKVINVVDSGVRARYREGNLNEPSLIEPGKIYEYEILIGSTAIYFPKKHRIRLEISSSYFPRYDINSNLGGEKNEKGYTIAKQVIYHDDKHPSCLILPKYNLN
ncbi:MAG: CocE/NonD family hydrolase [Promethearchaeota archaeon]